MSEEKPICTCANCEKMKRSGVRSAYTGHIESGYDCARSGGARRTQVGPGFSCTQWREVKP